MHFEMVIGAHEMKTVIEMINKRKMIFFIQPPFDIVLLLVL